MHAERTAYELELLAHFDNADAEETGDVAPTCSRVVPVRGIGWVLQWAAALAVMFVATSLLAQFAYCLAAEQTLQRAARAGAWEATLPRATYESVVATIDRGLAASSLPPHRLRFSLLQNGVPTSKNFRPAAGDRFSVLITVPSDAVYPNWLRSVNFWNRDSQIAAHAERNMPGKYLASPPTP